MTAVELSLLGLGAGAPKTPPSKGILDKIKKLQNIYILYKYIYREREYLSSISKRHLYLLYLCTYNCYRISCKIYYYLVGPPIHASAALLQEPLAGALRRHVAHGLRVQGHGLQLAAHGAHAEQRRGQRPGGEEPGEEGHLSWKRSLGKACGKERHGEKCLKASKIK